MRNPVSGILDSLNWEMYMWRIKNINVYEVLITSFILFKLQNIYFK